MSEETILAEQDVEEVETEEVVTEGVSEEPTEESEPKLSAREQMVKDIADRQREERQKDQEDESEEEPEEEPEAPEEEATQKDADEPESKPEEQVEYVTIKVDGVEKEVPRDKVLEQGIRTLQKDSAADARLNEASKRLKELQQYEAYLREQADKLKVPASTTKDEREQFAKALIEDEDKAAEMFSESQQRVKELEQLVHGLSDKVNESTQFVQDQRVNQAKKINNLFKREFPGLAKYQHLRDMVNDETKIIMQSDPDLPPEDVLMQAGNRVKQNIAEDLGYIEPPEDGVTETSPEPKRVKQKMPKPVRKASGRRPSKPEKKRQTASDIIAGIAARRRQY